MAEIGTARVKVIPELDGVELMEHGVLDQIAASARRHQVMISLTFSPYDETEETD